MTTSGTAHIFCTVAATWTSNGVQWSGVLNMSGGVLHTIADAWNVGGLSCGSSAGGGTQTTTINGAAITVRGGYANAHTAAGIVTGNSEFIFVGTGNLSTAGTATAVTRNPFTINMTGTLTLTTHFRYNTGTLKYIAGTVTPGAFAFVCSASTTLDVAGITWNTVIFDGAASTITLLSDINLSSTLSIGSTASNVTVNGATFNLNAKAAVNLTGTSGIVSGTATLNLMTTTTQTVTKTAGGGAVNLPITVNAPSGTVNFVGDLGIKLNNMLCVAGSIVTPEGAWTILGGGGSAQTSYAEIL